MFYIGKQREVPIEFQNAIRGLESYHELQGENRQIVTTLLLEEQGGLCPLCERKHIDDRGETPRTVFTPTIEHFLPFSIFVNLRLDYHNFYVSCQACNEPKANHLIPAYIFDPRLNPFQTETSIPKGLKISYFLEDGKVFVRIPLASSTKEKQITSEHHSAYLMQSTLDMTRQNRYTPSDGDYKEYNSLLIQRASIWRTIISKIQNLPNNTLVEKYNNLRNRTEYPQFVSLIAFLYHKEFSKRGLPIP
jgi:uncharacterized protein (TIGR02646 family)